MPGENIFDWSTTAANNDGADSLINWHEGQPRASVNDSARSLMAAIAKNRDLQNGTITTTGTGTLQAFTSGVGYVAVPTGLRVLLKIGATNTGAATLNMDGIGAVAIKDQRGNDLVGGELVTGGYAELTYDGTNWILLSRAQGSTISGAGIFRYGGPNLLTFKPCNGSLIKINGLLYDIPTAGIAGLNNAFGVYVDGVAGQLLTANTTYHVHVRNLGGVLTADFLSGGFHIPSPTAGNIGTEIYSTDGVTPDDTRTLIGMVRTNASLQFADSASKRLVSSWFNRTQKSTGPVYLPSPSSIGSGPFADINAAYRIEFLNWLGDAISADLNAVCIQALAASRSFVGLGWDGTMSYYVYWHAPGSSYAVPVSLSGTMMLAEGYHFQYVGAGIDAGSSTLTIDASGYTSMSAVVLG